MNISRYLSEKLIKMEMTTVIEPLEENQSEEKWRQIAKEKILDELVSLLETGNHIGNRTKLLTDFINRERKATTGIVDGIAVPHIRSMQARDLMIAVARSSAGYDFGALDGELTHLFFVMAAPPYDDALYLRVFKSLMEKLHYDSFREELMSATEPGELLHTIRAME
ncbi:MAG: PTS sugar transporter subunit IIA [candidate division Zixibacteria bacterium]|nr:PTS sugar transporter subunit IIA [candidate division Zixibacteria bacterium]